jgi:hypothetical protein
MNIVSSSVLSATALVALLAAVVSCSTPDAPAPVAAPVPSAATPAAADTPPQGWVEWARWADARQGVSDGRGHGPDVGSTEWAEALARRLGVTDGSGHGPDVGSAEWRQAVERKLAGPAADRGSAPTR